MKYRLLLCLASLLPAALFGQNNVDYDIFMDAAGLHSVLFNGAFPMRHGYRTSSDGSTFFAYSTHFEEGEVLFCGKLYKNVLLNLNAHADELYAQDGLKGIPVLVNKSFIESFTMGTRRFVRYEPEPNTLLKEGFYEVLYSGKLLLYKKIQKQLRDETSGGKIVRKYLLSENFFMQKENKWYRISKKADLKKLFPEHKKAIDNFAKTRFLNFKILKDFAFIEIVNYIDHL